MPEGAPSLERCWRIICEIEAAELELARTWGAPRGTLHVGLPQVAMLMMPTLKRFHGRRGDRASPEATYNRTASHSSAAAGRHRIRVGGAGHRQLLAAEARSAPNIRAHPMMQTTTPAAATGSAPRLPAPRPLPTAKAPGYRGRRETSYDHDLQGAGRNLTTSTRSPSCSGRRSTTRSDGVLSMPRRSAV
jgi:hypothetical protein